MRKFAIVLAALCLAGCASFGWRSSAPRPAVYVVFFPDRTVTLTANGDKIVRDAASAAAARSTETVEITGPSTRVAPGYDPSLAAPRIKLVQNALVADGVSADRIVMASETTDGVNVKSDPSGAQRVEIRLVEKPAGVSKP
ncbi:MAG TPA: hypothetical protein VMH86_08420 [Rhizomicrobium sp.]|nr:hypothetical protein [Rhizomicrobium sp.]